MEELRSVANRCRVQHAVVEYWNCRTWRGVNAKLLHRLFSSLGSPIFTCAGAEDRCTIVIWATLGGRADRTTTAGVETRLWCFSSSGGWIVKGLSSKIKIRKGHYFIVLAMCACAPCLCLWKAKGHAVGIILPPRLLVDRPVITLPAQSTSSIIPQPTAGDRRHIRTYHVSPQPHPSVDVAGAS
jgi:hypothetical protein